MPSQHVYGFKCAFLRSNSNRKLPCLLHTDAERKTAKKIPEVLQKRLYKNASGMKKHHQSHCRLVEHICRAAFSLKTCKQSYEHPLCWSGCVNPVPHWLVPDRRCSAGGGGRMKDEGWWLLQCVHSWIFCYFLFMSCSTQILQWQPGRDPAPSAMEPETWHKANLVCFCVYEQQHEWEALSK